MCDPQTHIFILKYHFSKYKHIKYTFNLTIKREGKLGCSTCTVQVQLLQIQEVLSVPHPLLHHHNLLPDLHCL